MSKLQYFYFVLFIGAALFIFLINRGLAHQYLWPAYGLIDRYAAPLATGLMLFSGLKFTAIFTKADAHLPRLNRAINIFSLVIGLVAGVGLFFSPQIHIWALLALMAAGFLLLLATAAAGLRQGDRPARYVFLAWLLLLLLGTANILLNLRGLTIPSHSQPIPYLGGLAIILLLALALAGRLNAIKKEKDAAQAELIRQQAEALRLKTELADTLEQRVTARTTELEQANARLHREIAQRRRVAADLQERERILSTLFSNLPGMAYRCRNDRHWTMEFVSKGCTKLTGYRPVDLLNNAVVAYADLIHPDDREPVWQAVQLALQELRPFQLTYRITTKTGRQKWVWEQGQGIFSDQGNLLALEGLIQDITERKQAQAELEQRAKEMTALAMENARLLAEEQRRHKLAQSLREVATILTSTLDRKTILSKILAQLGRVIPHDGAAIFLPDGDDLVLSAGNVIDESYIGIRIPLSSQNPGARAFKQQKLLIVPDVHHDPGWEIWPGGAPIRSWMGAPMMSGQTLIGIITADNFTVNAYTGEDGQILQIFADQAAIAIENARLFDEAQQAREAAEAASRAKSAFLANMSHELRTPLNAILGFSELMARDANLTPDQQENLSIINKSGEHLLTLINNILDMSRIEAGRMVLHEQNFDLFKLLEELDGMFRLQAEDKGLILGFERDRHIPKYVRTDKAKLRQVLINLLRNAIKFTSKGYICLRVRAGQTPDTLYFEVEDTGPGIAPAEQETIFEPFAQTQTGAQAREGTGLGLPISRQFVQLLGGSLKVESRVGQGSVFAFNIRVKPVEATEAMEPAALAAHRIAGLAPGQPVYRILIVDDRWDNRQVLVKLLDLPGFNLKEAADGREAVEIWQNWQPHLIWMDIQMPVMDGLEAARRIKAAPAGRQTVIIAVTAGVSQNIRDKVMAAGCNGLLRKPFREQEVFDLLSAHLGVRFIVDEQAGTTPAGVELAPIPPDALPPGWAEKMKQATYTADWNQIMALIEQIRNQNNTLADTLTHLAHNFDYHTIRFLIGGANQEPS